MEEREIEDEADSKCFYSACFFSESHDSEEWFACQKCLSGHITHFVQTVGKGPLCMTGVRNGRHFFY